VLRAAGDSTAWPRLTASCASACVRLSRDGLAVWQDWQAVRYLIIGAFTATETGYTGKLDTLAIKANVQFERVDDKAKDTHPDYRIVSSPHEREKIVR
jgi:Protein of unknown function (DUF736)